MNEEQLIWVRKISGALALDPLPERPTDQQLAAHLVAIRAKEEEDEQKQKEVYLARFYQKAAAEKKRLQEAFVFEVQSQGKRISSLGAGGDSTQTFDLDSATEELDEAVDMQRMKLLIEGTDRLLELRRELEAPTCTRTALVQGQLVKRDEPLFSRQEIMDEVYTPLVREQILPETFVPKEFSAVQQMLDESNEFYLKELESYKPAEDEDRSGDVLKVVSALSTLTQAVEGAVGAPEKVVEAAQNATKLVESVVKLSVGAYQATRTQTVDKTKSVIDQVGSIAAKIIGGTAGKALQAGIAATTSAAAMVGHLAKPEPDIDAFLNDLITGIGEGFSFAQSATSGKTSTDLTVASDVTTAVLGGLLKAKKKNLLENVEKQEWDKVADFVATSAAKALQVAFKAMNDEKSVEPSGELKAVKKKLEQALSGEKSSENDEEIEKLKQEKERLSKELEELAEKTTVAKETLGESSKQIDEALELGEAAEKKLKELEANRKKRDEAATNEGIEERMKREREDFEAGLNGLGAVNPNENDLKSIANLIAQMERDRGLWQIMLSVANAGAAVGTQIFGPMAASGTLVEFIASARLAVDRLRHMLKWQASLGEAQIAVSPYASSIQNFIQNQKEQFTHHTLDAGLKALKAATQIASAAGVSAPFAKVAEATIGLAATAEELVYQHYKEKKVDQAWKITRQALDNPNNRKLGLIARKMNPTLAKYAIAYGAVVRKEPIAMSAMNRIGLDRETLARRDTSVGEVKKFLDTLYNEDVVVLGEYEPKDWPEGKPPKAALNVKCWLATVAIAKENKKLHASPHLQILEALKEIEKTEDALGKAAAKNDGGDEPLYEPAIAAHELLMVAVRTYAPTEDAENKPATDMVKIARGFGDLAEVRRAELIGAAP